MREAIQTVVVALVGAGVVGLRLWAAMAYARFVDELPPAERAKLLAARMRGSD